MTWLAILFGGIAVLLAVPLVVGSFLPRDHVARMTISLAAPPERVWALVSDFAGAPRWRSDLQRVELQPGPGGAQRFVETTRQGTVTFEVVSQEPPRRQVVRVVDEGQPFGGTWTWEIQPEGSGARLTITEAGFVKNPIFRVMSRLFFPPTAALDRYLRALARELGENAEPRVP
ncbi:MAG TPA: SRPBCC family protein [Gemmatimonadales bacterium]|nr:SRPBCC family protein [Gemmatimonadales bacterium]